MYPLCSSQICYFIYLVYFLNVASSQDLDVKSWKCKDDKCSVPIVTASVSRPYTQPDDKKKMKVKGGEKVEILRVPADQNFEYYFVKSKKDGREGLASIKNLKEDKMIPFEELVSVDFPDEAPKDDTLDITPSAPIQVVDGTTLPFENPALYVPTPVQGSLNDVKTQPFLESTTPPSEQTSSMSSSVGMNASYGEQNPPDEPPVDFPTSQNLSYDQSISSTPVGIMNAAASAHSSLGASTNPAILSISSTPDSAQQVKETITETQNALTGVVDENLSSLVNISTPKEPSSGSPLDTHSNENASSELSESHSETSKLTATDSDFVQKKDEVSSEVNSPPVEGTQTEGDKSADDVAMMSDATTSNSEVHSLTPVQMSNETSSQGSSPNVGESTPGTQTDGPSEGVKTADGDAMVSVTTTFSTDESQNASIQLTNETSSQGSSPNVGESIPGTLTDGDPEGDRKADSETIVSVTTTFSTDFQSQNSFVQMANETSSQASSPAVSEPTPGTQADGHSEGVETADGETIVSVTTTFSTDVQSQNSSVQMANETSSQASSPAVGEPTPGTQADGHSEGIKTADGETIVSVTTTFSTDVQGQNSSPGTQSYGHPEGYNKAGGETVLGAATDSSSGAQSQYISPVVQNAHETSLPPIGGDSHSDAAEITYGATIESAASNYLPESQNLSNGDQLPSDTASILDQTSINQDDQVVEVSADSEEENTTTSPQVMSGVDIALPPEYPGIATVSDEVSGHVTADVTTFTESPSPSAPAMVEADIPPIQEASADSWYSGFMSSIYSVFDSSSNSDYKSDVVDSVVHAPEVTPKVQVDEKSETCTTDTCENDQVNPGLEEDYSRMVPDNLWLSPGSTILMIITAAAVLIFSLGYYYLENLRRDVELVAKYNDLAGKLFIEQKEKEMLADQLSSVNESMNQMSFDTSKYDEEISELRALLNKYKEEKAAIEVKEKETRKKFMMVDKNYNELKNIISQNKQKGERSALIIDINNLKDSIAANNIEIASLKEQLIEKKEEIKALNSRIVEFMEINKGLEENFEKAISESHETAQKYQDNITKLERTIEENTTARVKLEKECTQLKKEKEALAIEKELAESSLQKFQRLTPSNALTEWLDAKEVRVSLLAAEKKIEELTTCQDQLARDKKIAEEKGKSLQEDFEQLNEKYEKAEKDKIEALTRLQVLSDYFKEKETQLQEELGTKESLWLQKQSDDRTIYEQMRALREENSSFKNLNETLKREILDQEASFKKLLASAEEKAHENWVALRHQERRLKEAQVEAAQLRSRLTHLESAGDIADDKMNKGEVNGDMPPYGSATSPPFMLYPEFVPPPPLLPSTPSRPPPLGRISSPPLGDFTPPPPLVPYEMFLSPSPPPPAAHVLHKPQPLDGSHRIQKDSQSSNHSSESAPDRTRRNKR